MLFNSLEFGIFFAAVFTVYLLLPRRAQNVLLLLASYVFYAAWDWRFLSLLWVSTAVDYTVGLALRAETDARRRRLLVSISLATNLGLLGFFKYAGFFAAGFGELARALGVEVSPWTLTVVLPVGVSFYTFQTLSYTIDVYRRRMEPTRNVLEFALFVAFFPQLVAGPIERASRLLPQLSSRRKVTWENVGSGAWLAVWGLFKKVVIADNLGVLVDAVYAPGAEPTGVEVVLASYAFTIQIYCDFSGYTDIARGIARMMGFDIMLNFNLPCFATSVADFWDRWHISLSTWLRDYVYIPLGGNRKGVRRTHVNLAATMLLGGLWHGAAWNFVIWGAYHGALLSIHRALAPQLARIDPHTAIGRAAWRVVRIVFVFQLIALGLLIFRAESLVHIVTLLSALGDLSIGLARAWIAPFCALVIPLFAMEVAQLWTKDLEFLSKRGFAVRTVVYTVVALLIVLQGEDGAEPFIYFQF